MAINFTQTDTSNALNVACFGGAGGDDFLGETNAVKDASDGATAGSTEITKTVSGESTDGACLGFECAVDGGVSWDAGTWTVRFNVTSSNMFCSWASVYICRVNSSDVNQETLGSSTGLGIGLDSTGVKSTTVTGSAATPSAGDKVLVVFGFSNSSMNNQTVGITPDQNIDSPFTAAGATTVTTTADALLKKQDVLLTTAVDSLLKKAGIIVNSNTYEANAVNFDGTNDYLTRGADLTGNANGKVGVLSFWINNKGTEGSDENIFRSSTDKILIYKNTSESINISLSNASGTLIMRRHSDTGAAAVANGWIHVLCSWDLANTSGNLYINDVPHVNFEVTTDDTIDYTETDHAVGATTAGAGKLEADIADFYLNTAEYLDISDPANRRKFSDSVGRPVDLGSDGSTPTGTAPIVFLSGATDTWHTNDGTGGGFTENGALTDGANSPSDKVGSTAADAVLVKTMELTVAADALLKALGVSQTTTIDALLKKLGVEQTTTADALLQKTLALTTSADSVLLKNVLKTTTADALLQKAGLATATTADALLKKLGLTRTTTADALLVKTLELNTTIDALLQATVTTNTTADALLKALDVAVTAQVDALLQKQGITTQTSVDALLLKNALVSTTGDALLKKAGLTLTVPADALLKKAISLSVGTDALLKKQNLTLTTAADAVLTALGGGGTVTTGIDALLQKQGITLTTSVDAILQKIARGAYPTRRVRFKNHYYQLPRDRNKLAQAMQEWLQTEPVEEVAETEDTHIPAAVITADDGVRIAVLDPPELKKRDLGVLERRLKDLHFDDARIKAFLFQINLIREMEKDEEDAVIALLLAI